jgi:hypothetical protein
MKPFRLFEIPVLLFGLGTALVLSPRSRAQSEIASDHFDGADRSEAADEKAGRPKIQQAPKADFDATGNLAARYLVKEIPLMAICGQAAAYPMWADRTSPTKSVTLPKSCG